METEKFKYTTDGKKVVVIGDLNQTEKIVQEIYVTEDGCEIPQGERFVVNSLLDVPAKSWKAKELEKLELEYKDKKSYWESEIKKLVKEKSSAYNALSARVKWLRNVAKEPQMKSLNNALNTIADFMDGSEKWILVRDYKGYILEKFDDNGVSLIMDRFDEGRYDSMRLLSLFGRSDGYFDFRINSYSDDTGYDDKVLFFKSEREALNFMQKEFDSREGYCAHDIETLNKYHLHIDPEKYNKYQNKWIENSYNQIKYLEGALEKEYKKYNELKNTIK